ncbi:jg10243 [Pararge aegeria aegeria]|uniref:Jg10243 protein n=1 Tax=Pararge aegeria aegeria TaxID=348720 RepID=A0A8S4SDY7_9NEOP|nr:jg10243 [Pararge aegeria aegeria]
MTLLLYDYCDLEERASRHLNVWKAWHLILYALAGIFGILNYVFLQNTMQLVDNNCVLFPRELAFRSIELTVLTNTSSINDTVLVNSDTTENTAKENAQNVSVPGGSVPTNDDKNEPITKRDLTNSNNTRENDTDSEANENDVNFISGKL